MAKVMGIDPGASTGVAIFVDGAIDRLCTVRPLALQALLEFEQPDRVIIEDSRLQSHVYSGGQLRQAQRLKVARNVGQIDAWCTLIVEVCELLQIPAQGISPKGKGSKLDAAQFANLTGYTGKSNQHERDAACVAWPHRHVACSAQQQKEAA